MAVFDSGLGGLSVLNHLRRLAPGQPLLYLADQAYAPYGDRSLIEVRDRAEAVARHLLSARSELVVVACNTASAAALHHLRRRFPDVHFVGMEPAVKPAAGASRSGVVGVLATTATFQGELFASVVDRFAEGVEVIAQPCPGLADAVERGRVNHPDTLTLLRRYVEPLLAAGADTLVLGCTHYSFLAPELRRLAPDTVLIDPSEPVARQAVRVLSELGRAGTDTIASVRYRTTGRVERMRAGMLRLTGERPPVESIQI